MARKKRKRARDLIREITRDSARIGVGIGVVGTISGVVRASTGETLPDLTAGLGLAANIPVVKSAKGVLKELKF